MQILKSISLDFGRKSEYKTVYAKRYEAMNSNLEISLLNYGESFNLESNMTAKMQLLKPDGRFVVAECTENYGGAADKILVEFPIQAFAVPGIGRAEIALYRNGSFLSAQKFYIEIEDNEVADAFSSSNEFRALDEALYQVGSVISSAEEAAGAANTAASNANSAAAAANAAAENANSAAEAANNAADAANIAANTANSAAENANTAAENASQAASGANTAAGSANAASSAANTAAENANAAATAAHTAADAANTAANAANAAAEMANTAAETANAAASGAENVNISAVQTPAGAEITVTDRTGAETTVDITSAPVTRYGVRFDGSANSGATVHRLYNAVGLVAGVGTDAETARNDFDNIYPWSARKRCCGNFDADGNFTVNAYEGEPGYAVDGSNGEVWVEHSLFYYSHKYGEDGSEEIVISATPLPDMLSAPIFVKRDGTLKQKAYTAAYPMAEADGKAASRSGVFPKAYSLDLAMTSAGTLGEGYAVTRMNEIYTEWLYMFVEFGTRNLQSVMKSACEMAFSAGEKALAAETGTNRIIVSPTAADKFVTGQTIAIDASSRWGQNVANNRIVTGFETVGANKAICFDGEPVDIAVGNVVSSRAWKTGSCDGVLSSSGSPVSNTDGKHDCIYRGKEKPYGGSSEFISDILLKRTGEGTADNPYIYEIWYLPDTVKYAAGAITADYVRLNYQLPAANGYIKKLGFDSRYPGVCAPCESGASSGTYYCDSYSKPSANVCAFRSGGSWDGGTSCGSCAADCRFFPNNADITFSARLSGPR